MRKSGPLESQRTSMLNLRRASTFRYDLREILADFEVNETVAGSILASIVAKGSRVSIESAKSFVREQVKLGSYPIEASEEICSLLDRWSTYR